MRKTTCCKHTYSRLSPVHRISTSSRPRFTSFKAPPRTVTRRRELRRTNPSYSGTCRVAPLSSRGLELGVGDVWNRLDFLSNYESNLSFQDPEFTEFHPGKSYAPRGYRPSRLCDRLRTRGR